jgi:hypothetical protein
MVGRLHSIIAQDIPTNARDPPRFPFLHAFFNQAKVPSVSSLIPSIGCLTQPGGVLFDLLSGHSDALLLEHHLTIVLHPKLCASPYHQVLLAVLFDSPRQAL